MSVIMMIIGSLATALLVIGIVRGVVLSVALVFRMAAEKGNYNGDAISSGKRVLISGVCVLNVFFLLVGGYLGISTYQTHKDELWGCVRQQSEKDNILPDFLQEGNETRKQYNKELEDMNNILDDAMKVSGNISPLSVAVLILISIVGVVFLIALCNGALIAVKKFWDKLFHNK